MYGGRSQNSSRFQLTVHNHRNWRRETVAQSTPPTTESIKREGKKKGQLASRCRARYHSPRTPSLPPKTHSRLFKTGACMHTTPSPLRHSVTFANTKRARGIGARYFFTFFSGNSLGFPIGEATGPRFFCFLLLFIGGAWGRYRPCACLVGATVRRASAAPKPLLE